MLEISTLNRILTVDEKNGSFFLENELRNTEIIALGKNRFQFLLDHNSHVIEVISYVQEDKALTLKINNKLISLTIKDEMDQLLHRLGFDTKAVKKVNDLKAPMPGMVLKVLIEVGQTIEKGDPILVLESMKMENVLKAAGDGVIKSISAIAGKAVEKGELLISFE